VITAKRGPAWPERPMSLAEQLERSVEALGHRLWTDEELNRVHAELGRLLREGPPVTRINLTERGLEETEDA